MAGRSQNSRHCCRRFAGSDLAALQTGTHTDWPPHGILHDDLTPDPGTPDTLILQNPLDVVATPPPSFSLRQVVAIAREHYCLEVRAAVLVSERDQNFHLTTDSGQQFVLKIANAAEDPVVSDFQIQALLHIQAKADPELTTPTVLRTGGGEHSVVLEAEGRSHVARIVSFLHGTPIGSVGPDAALAKNMGRYLARLGIALNDFSHPGADHSLLWDMKQASALQNLLHHIRDTDVRSLAAKTLDHFSLNVLPVFDSLRWQVIHNDMNLDNILIKGPSEPQLAGIIDFGDMLRSPLIIDVAVAASYLRAFDGNPLALIAGFIAGYHQETPLTLTEIDMLHDLVKMRLATTVLILAWRQSVCGPADDYLQAAAAVECNAELFLRTMSEIPRENAAQTYRQVCASVAHTPG